MQQKLTSSHIHQIWQLIFSFAVNLKDKQTSNTPGAKE